jgi:hypothetical protein
MSAPDSPPSPARDAIGRVAHAFLASVGILVSIAAPPPANAQPERAPDAPQTEAGALEVKAAYLYKFANYVDWPAGAFQDEAHAIVIGVLGDDQLSSELRRLVQGKSVKGRGFMVRKLRPGDDLGGIHILFLGDIEAQALEAALAAAANRDVLTVADSRRAFASGCMVNLVMVNQRLRFEVAQGPVQRSRLRLSALMLTAAYRVQKERP